MPKKNFHSTYSAAVLIITALPFAQAQTASPTIQDMTGSNMCLQSANFPKPHGESDLKGNAKLPAYCDCFMAKFGARAQKAALDVQANPGKTPRKTLQESHAEELAMRNSCRQQLGLPPVADHGK